MRQLILCLVFVSANFGQEVKPPPAPIIKDENLKRWHPAVKAVASGYRQWQRLEDEMRWAPWLCRMPSPAPARFSAADKKSAHGRKLYALYARDPVAYGCRPTPPLWTESELKDPESVLSRMRKQLSEFDQVIVKEAWVPERMSEPPTDPFGPGLQTRRQPNWGKSQLRPVKRGEHYYRADKPGGLFLMLKARDRKAKDTDKGWIYATVTPEGQVTGAGRMQPCMACHKRNPDRLFGPPDSARAPKKTTGKSP